MVSIPTDRLFDGRVCLEVQTKDNQVVIDALWCLVKIVPAW